MFVFSNVVPSDKPFLTRILLYHPTCSASTNSRIDPTRFPADERYPGLFSGECGPTSAVIADSESPLPLFLFFMSRSLWKKIARKKRTDTGHSS